mgnify:FL=1
MVRDGAFREDLFYRINTMHINLPALRERNDEIIPLAEMFLKKYADRYRRNVSMLSEEAVAKLMEHRWSGNIRELQNCIEKAVILSEGDALNPQDIQLPQSSHLPEEDDIVEETLEMVEERTIRAAMTRFDGNLSLVAKSLDISRPTLYSKLKKYNI